MLVFLIADSILRQNMWSFLLICFYGCLAVEAKKHKHFVLYEWDTGLITAKSGCVTHRTMLPEKFYSLRVDARDYSYRNGKCIADVDASDTLKCSIKEVVHKKMYLTEVTICNPQERIWLGFKLPKFFAKSRYGYVTNFFYPGGEWTKAYKYCLQPNLSSPLRIFAKGENEVEITCTTRKSSCSASPWVVMFTPDQELCRNFSAPFCGKKDNGDVVEYTYTLQRHNQGHQFEYVFCSTSNSYLSTVIDWENKEYEGDDDIGGSEGGKDKEESGDDGDEEDNGDGGDKEDNEDGKDEEDGQRGDENAGDDDVGGPEDDDIQCRDSRKETSIRDLEKSVFVSEDDGVDLSDFAEVDDE